MNSDDIQFRNHFTYVFEEAWKTMAAIVAFFLFSEILPELINEIRAGNRIMAAVILGAVAVVFLVVILIYVNRWRKTIISIREGIITIERKLIMHYRNDIAIANISNVNLEQNIFEMIFRTYKLKIDTNSSSTANKTDVKIVLKADMAYKIKNIIMKQMVQIKNSGDIELMQDADGKNEVLRNDRDEIIDVMGDIAENQYDIIYDNKTIIRNCIAKTSVLLVLIIIGIFVGLGFQISDMIKEGKTIGATILTMFATLIVNMSLIRSVMGNWLKDFRFRIKRHDDKIYVSCGLLKRKKYAIPINKINGVRMYNGFIGRLMNLYCVEIISVGGEEEDALGKMVLLAEKPEKLREKLAVILPEYEFPEFSKIKRMPKKVLFMRYIKGILYFVPVSIGAYVGLVNVIGYEELDMSNDAVLITAGIVGGLFVLYCIIATLSYYMRGLYIGKNDLVSVEGCFAKRIISISYDKMQYIEYGQGLFDRMINVGKAEVSILATQTLSKHSTGKYDMQIYEKLNEKLRETY